NVAGLLLARSITRARETALRVALGASQWRLAAQYFAEGVLVAMAGAAGGIVISIALTRLVLSLAADTIPRADDIGINWTVLLFAFAVSVLCTVLCSLAPLWQAVRILPNEALSDGVRASAPARSRRLSRTLVIAEIALAFTLLSVSSVLLAHLNQLLRVAPGFEPNGVATFTVNANRADYPQFDQLSAYQTRLLNSIQQIPGVNSAALVDHLPLNGCCMTTSLFPDGISNADKGYREVNIIGISSQYFQTMQIPVLQGRAFNAADDGKGDVLNIVIDSAAAKEYWGGRDALGAYAHLGGPNGSRVRVVGIVGNVRNRGLGDATEAEVYVPSTAMPINPMQFVVRSAVPVSALIPAVRRVVQGVDRAQSIYDARPLKQIVLGSLTAERLQSLLTAFFASAAMLLAALGVYGVVSYSVRQRTVEIGTRMALGAVGRDILALVLGDGFKMAVYGVAAGCVVVVGAVFVLKASIFGIRIDDPLPFLYSTGIVASFAAIACFFPGWRATLVTPMVAIRDDPGSLWRSAVDFVERVSHLMPGPARELSDNNLLAKFVQSSRQAESLRQAIQLSLDALREAIKSRSALLLERRGAEYRCTIQSPRELPPTCSLPVDGLLLGRLRGYLYPLPLTPGDLDAWRRWASAKQEHLAEIESLEKAGVALAVPLLDKNEIAGILLLGPPEDRAQFSDGEKRALHNCA
ncbi:MAG TPA: FtsX-like permease family protein, partial [Bryobacteraceae bacterium]|nr:FtsX-like permease family protein [Bryobacteraceae bacterium]